MDESDTDLIVRQSLGEGKCMAMHASGLQCCLNAHTGRHKEVMVDDNNLREPLIVEWDKERGNLFAVNVVDRIALYAGENVPDSFSAEMAATFQWYDEQFAGMGICLSERPVTYRVKSNEGALLGKLTLNNDGLVTLHCQVGTFGHEFKLQEFASVGLHKYLAAAETEHIVQKLSGWFPDTKIRKSRREHLYKVWPFCKRMLTFRGVHG